MTQEYRSQPLKFSMEETVLFRKDEEIDELYSLSLEPNVSITDLEHFISIRGSLEMTGEYKKADNEPSVESDFSYPERRYVSVSESRNDGICYFQYQFPVDITVPKARVHNPEELSITIDSFDYTMPDNNCLVVSTELSVLGVYEESREEKKRVYEEFTSEQADFDDAEWNPQDFLVPLVEDFDDEDDDELTFTVEAKKQEARETDDDDEFQIPVQVVYNTNEGLSSTQPNEHLSERNEVEEESSKQTFYPPEASSPEVVLASDYREKAEEDEGADVQETFVPRREELDDETEVEDTVEVDTEAEDTAEEEAIEEETSEDDTVIDLKQVRTEKSINYSSKSTEENGKRSISLTQFFAHKDENRTAKMRVYFVQQEDTLSLIAERYEVNVSQLLRANDLEPHQDLSEGQILYIPT